MRFEDMNDLEMKTWREIDLPTKSLWLSTPNEAFYIPEVKGIQNDPNFHGLFVPYIPYYAIKRFTKVGETVWDCFAGSGTTYRVAKRMLRECICNDVVSFQDYIVEADSTYFNPGKLVQLIIMHPPYYKIVEYPKDTQLSGASSLVAFLENFRSITKNVVQYLEAGRILVLVCGNIFLEKEEVTLGHMCKDIVRLQGFRLRSHIVKSYGETKGGSKRLEGLRRYRGLKFGFNDFYGDNIFILQKTPSVNLKRRIQHIRQKRATKE